MQLDQPTTVFKLLSAGALLLTTSYNVLYFSVYEGDLSNLLQLLADWFWTATRSSPSHQTVGNEIVMLLLMAIPFFHVEALRAGMPRPWRYVIGGFMIAIGVTFPLFIALWLARSHRTSRRHSEESDDENRKPRDLGWELSLFTCFMVLMYSGFRYVNTREDKDSFTIAFVFFYVVCPAILTLVLELFSRNLPVHDQSQEISEDSSNRLEMMGIGWSLLSVAVVFSSRVRSMGGLSSWSDVIFSDCAPCSSLTWDYVVMAITCALFVIFDPKPTKSMYVYAAFSLIFPPIGFSAYVAQREMDRRRSERHALSQIGKILAVASIFSMVMFIGLFRVFNFSNFERKVFHDWIGFGAYHDAPHYKLYHIFNGDPWVSITHVLAGFVFLLLIPFQFNAGLRKANIEWHRWFGRLFFLCSVSISYGLLLFLQYPEKYIFDEGQWSWWPTFVFSLHFVATGTLAFYYAWVRDIPTHRRWIIRHCANAMGVGSYRSFTVAAGFLVQSMSAGIKEPKALFGTGIWIVWPICILLGEGMIMYRSWEPGMPQPKKK